MEKHSKNKHLGLSPRCWSPAGWPDVCFFLRQNKRQPGRRNRMSGWLSSRRDLCQSPYPATIRSEVWLYLHGGCISGSAFWFTQGTRNMIITISANGEYCGLLLVFEALGDNQEEAILMMVFMTLKIWWSDDSRKGPTNCCRHTQAWYCDREGPRRLNDSLMRTNEGDWCRDGGKFPHTGVCFWLRGHQKNALRPA